MMQWRTMDEWRAPEGPKNGTGILVLLADGERVVANYSGTSQRWFRGCGVNFSGEIMDWENPPVACEILPTPPELTERLKFIRAARDHLDKLETSPLAAAK